VLESFAMSKSLEKSYAISLRKSGLSFSQIKEKVDVSKSTLSLWLKDLPLTRKQINDLRSLSPRRIERFRNTMKKKRDLEEGKVFLKTKAELGAFSRRDVLIAGIFLYWGEGMKTAPCTVSLSNSDPDAVKFFVRWLNQLGVSNDRLKVVLHLYKDMDINREVQFWSDYLNIPIDRFRKPYIKDTMLCDITYKSGFGHGTCNVMYLNKELYLYVKSCLKFVHMRA